MAQSHRYGSRNVWSIRTKLQIDGRLRDLAMFNLAIDSKLRGCDVITLRVEDIAPHGAALHRATVRSLSPSKWTSEVLGQSGHALPSS